MCIRDRRTHAHAGDEDDGAGRSGSGRCPSPDRRSSVRSLTPFAYKEVSTMSRTYVVTGSASGIGKKTAELLSSQGAKVIGADLKNSDINVDLATPAGRANLVAEARLLGGGKIDGVLAVSYTHLRAHET